ncbi:inositol monophosphatase family protein [Microbacterium mangrovi]|uniref:inositol monophosphatase family protein n=1 Tax=Microbacterium mangrovi TaxID=1348253 RepID=UPI00069127C3|nr:inositol monophosphatase family protein [Microbacterium mangrovi]
MLTESAADPVELRHIAIAGATIGRDILASGTVLRDLDAKSPGDVVTDVDRRIEQRIRAHVESVRPEDRIVGEELPDSGSATSGIEWYIDPIDGTTNFVLGLGLHCTSVAAYDARTGQWLAGAVAVPSDGSVYSAARGQGAQKEQGDGSVVRLTAAVPPKAPRLLGVGLSYDPLQRQDQLAAIRDLMGDYDDMRSLGTAAYALCLVAEGRLAAFVESDLFVYDWAAGALIAEEAGAAVSRRADLARGAVSAVSRSTAHPSIA